MADWRLVLAATLLLLVAVAHSYLGERYILVRLFRRGDLPRIGPGEWFTRRTMRFAWHLTSVAWAGFGVLLAGSGFTFETPGPWVLWVTTVVFGAHAVVVLSFSRGHHLAWLVFGVIAVLCAWAAW